MTKTKKKYQFPQISRFIPASGDLKSIFYQGFLGFLLLGVFFLVLLNIFASGRQPKYLKDLLRNPTDIAALKSVLLQNQQPELDSFLKDYLRSSNPNEVIEIDKEQQQQRQAITDLEQLLVKYPQYPDGLAYLAVLYYQQRRCESALELINRALALDPNRPIFTDLKQIINQCLP